MARWRVLLVAVVVGTVGAAASATGFAGVGLGAGSSWTLPVDGPVVRPFEAPRTPYGPGHRGVDLAVAAGTPVQAAGPGVVVFAGRIGPSSHVVVLHAPSGWRTGYSFLSGVAVHVGQTVSGGTVVGTSGGIGDGHDGTVLHFSLRIGDEYVDPMILFRPIDLADAVHLAPTAGDRSGMGFALVPAARVSERAWLVAGLRGGAPERTAAGVRSTGLPSGKRSVQRRYF